MIRLEFSTGPYYKYTMWYILYLKLLDAAFLRTVLEGQYFFSFFFIKNPAIVIGLEIKKMECFYHIEVRRC